MRISLPFFPPFEIVGHRPGAPFGQGDVQADAQTRTRVNDQTSNQTSNQTNNQTNARSGTLPRRQIALQGIFQLVPMKIRRVPRPTWADAALSPRDSANSQGPLQALDEWVEHAPAEERGDYRRIADQFRVCWTDPLQTELAIYNFAGQVDLPPIPPTVSRLTLWACGGLTNLNASGCPQLQQVNISWCFGLRNLTLSQCPQLAMLHRAGCPNLATLTISGCTQLAMLDLPASHQLTTVDASGCTQLCVLDLTACDNLTTLNLDGCSALQTLELARCTSLNTLPQLSALRQLRSINLSDTALTSVPDDIVQLPQNCQIQLDASRLSDAVRNRLSYVMNTADYVGPRITYAMGGSFIRTLALPIDQEVAAWRTEAPEHLQQSLTTFDWSALPAKDSVAGFARFLALVRETNDYRHATPALKLATQQRVAALLVQLQNDPTLREDCFNLALDAVNTCGDRVALRLMDMEQLAIISQARAAIDAGKYDTDAQPLVDLCKGQFRLAIIAAAAENKAAGMHFTDPIEVHLGYLTKLVEPCKLPVRIVTMLYSACTDVTDDDLAAVYQQLMNTGSTPDERDANDRSYQNYLAGSDLMRQLLSRLRPADMSAINADNSRLIEQAQNSIRTQLDALLPTDPAYQQHSKRLMAEFHAVAADIPAQATLPLLQDFMATHGLANGLAGA